REAAVLPVSFWRGLDQGHRAALAVQVQPAVAVADRAGRNASLGPLHLAGFELGTHKRLAGAAVEVLADEYRAANGLGQLRAAVDLIGLGGVPLDREPHRSGALVIGAAVDQSLADDRRQDAHAHGARRPVVPPQELAGLGLHPEQAATRIG